MPLRRPPLAVLAALLAGALALAAPAHAVTVPAGFADDTLTSGLHFPRAFAFLPDGRVLIAEQHSAAIRMVVDHHIAAQDPIHVVEGVNPNGYERGLCGIAVDPQWPARPFVYVFFNGNPATNYLVRYTAHGSLTDAAAEALSLDTPTTLIGDIPDDNPDHQSGCMRFDADGMLYLSLGDDENDCVAQDSTSQRGQIVRLRVDGLRTDDYGGATVPRAQIVPPGNPLSTPDSNAMLVWAYGMRNPWSFDLDRTTGKLYVADVGESTEEELDEVRAGGNYGWPYREGLAVLDHSSDCPEPGGTGNAANGYLPPIVRWPRDTSLHAIFCGGLYRTVAGAVGNWPAEYDGNVFWGDFYVGDLHRSVRNPADGTWSEAAPVAGQPAAAWGTNFTYCSDARVGPDGSLWWLTQSASGSFAADGQLHRVRFVGATGAVPPSQAHPALHLACGPNPCRDRALFTLAQPAPGHVRLALYDLLGRHVATLLDADANAGETHVAWDAHAARPGMYLARLETASGVRTVRVMRVR